MNIAKDLAAGGTANLISTWILNPTDVVTIPMIYARLDAFPIVREHILNR